MERGRYLKNRSFRTIQGERTAWNRALAFGALVLESSISVSAKVDTPALDWRVLLGALDASEQHVVITDRRGRIVFANLSLAARHGRVRDELIGESIEQIVRSDNHSPS